jgi:hypothetical protein
MRRKCDTFPNDLINLAIALILRARLPPRSQQDGQTSAALGGRGK